MSLVQPDQGDARLSPGLSLNLSSNNPFRNRAASPALSTNSHSPLDAPPRPVSRNPFLDTASTAHTYSQSASSPTSNMAFGTDAKEQPRSTLSGNAADLFDNLTLEEKPLPSRLGPPARSNTSDKVENVRPRGPSHRPSRSQEEAMRARKAAAAGSSRTKPAKDELNIFADPSDSPKRSEPSRRPRRNSDSSIADAKGRLGDSEEEKKRQERRRRERRHAERAKGKKPKNLDVIDKLDVTSIYGTGLFHHDGPFDACNPHRNRKGSQRAPMSAFAKDSLNNSLGGGGPLNKRPDHATFMGNHDEEAFVDYAKGGTETYGFEPYNNNAARPPAVVDALARVEPIHGEETLGLGTSTFLEGTPASRTAMQRRESEQAVTTMDGGLSRKKSLAQKIRGISNNRREYGPSGRITSPDGVYNTMSPDPPVYSPGGGLSRTSESNPFAAEFSKDKETKITIAEPERRPARARAPSSPGRGPALERRATSDGNTGEDQPAPAKSSGGFLSRVKSLKGGPRKARPDRPQIPAQPAPTYE
ncbi:mucin-1 [Phlyctema vagabunda]|uniref:Mucin-1 n=1 Tax=Phlyctema vagabunda TaxID=108571 RepID=A0ABR4PT99_9HELO